MHKRTSDEPIFPKTFSIMIIIKDHLGNAPYLIGPNGEQIVLGQGPKQVGFFSGYCGELAAVDLGGTTQIRFEMF